VEEGGDDVDKKLVESSNQPVAIIDNSLFLVFSLLHSKFEFGE
jgi:hypothetical protein